MALHAAALAIQQRLTLDVAANRIRAIDLRVVPPLCPITVNPTDFSQAADLIHRAREHTTAWLTRLAQQGESATDPLGLHQHHARGSSGRELR